MAETQRRNTVELIRTWSSVRQGPCYKALTAPRWNEHAEAWQQRPSGTVRPRGYHHPRLRNLLSHGPYVHRPYIHPPLDMVIFTKQSTIRPVVSSTTLARYGQWPNGPMAQWIPLDMVTSTKHSPIRVLIPPPDLSGRAGGARRRAVGSSQRSRCRWPLVLHP